MDRLIEEYNSRIQYSIDNYKPILPEAIIKERAGYIRTLNIPVSSEFIGRLEEAINQARIKAGKIEMAYLVEPVLIFYGDLGPWNDIDLVVYLDDSDTVSSIISVWLENRFGLTSYDLNRITKIESEVWARYR